jgi:hypothetical protein
MIVLLGGISHVESGVNIHANPPTVNKPATSKMSFNFEKTPWLEDIITFFFQ